MEQTRGIDRFTIAIDGPAAAGKTTVGERVAERLGAICFDSGLLYRALTRVALDRGVDVTDEDALAAMAAALDVVVRPPTVDDGRQADVLVDGCDVTARLRTVDVDRNVSVASAHPQVRAVLLDQQRQIGRSGKVVMLGRDIGTTVMPGAELKIFMDASPEERARRRHIQLSRGGAHVSYDDLVEDIRRRDKIDSERTAAPLRPADDSVIVNTDPLTITEVVSVIVELAQERGLVGASR